MGLLDRFRLNDQVAIVTGAGRGIGQAIALAFAEMGADVVCAARTEREIEATADRVRGFGRRALALHCDVTHAAELDEVVARTIAEFGRVDLLVNNAGGFPPMPALDTDQASWEWCMRFNLTSAFLLTRACLPHMLARDGDAQDRHGRGRRPGRALALLAGRGLGHRQSRGGRRRVGVDQLAVRLRREASDMPYRVIQWSTGNVGRFALRCIVGHPELELVGLWVHGAAKAGKDAGELCGLAPACRHGGTSFFTSGIDPGFANDLLPLVLSGLSERWDEIRILEIINYATYDQPQVLFETMGFGKPLDHTSLLLAPGSLTFAW